MAALARPDAELRELARRARERTLAEHTADRRARELVAAIEGAAAGTAAAGALHAPNAALAAAEG